ncbi:DPP IV N-terminal domain-containing protein, partial [Acinetobacter baumannii]
VDLEDRAGQRLSFLQSKPAFILESDKTGWNHLYLHNNDGTLINAITSGNFTVLNMELIDEKNGLVYFTARGRENSARIDLYVVKMNGTD